MSGGPKSLAASQVAVLTGDVIRSTKLGDRSVLPGLLAEAFGILGTRPNTIVRPFETYRGDSFQGVVRATAALHAAALVRARLRAHEGTPPSRRGLIDARIAIGIGRVDAPLDRVAVSDGEAFRLSGRALDQLGQDSTRRLELAVAPDVVRRFGEVSATLLDVLIRRFDDIVSGWTVAAAGVVLHSWAEDLTQAQIAQRLGITQPAVSQRLRSAHAEEAKRILAGFECAMQAIRE